MRYISVLHAPASCMYELIEAHPRLVGIAVHDPVGSPVASFVEDQEMALDAADVSRLRMVTLGRIDAVVPLFLRRPLPTLDTLTLSLSLAAKARRDPTLDILDTLAGLSIRHFVARDIPCGPEDCVLGWLLRLLPASLRTLFIAPALAADEQRAHVRLKSVVDAILAGVCEAVVTSPSLCSLTLDLSGRGLRATDVRQLRSRLHRHRCLCAEHCIVFTLCVLNQAAID